MRPVRLRTRLLMENQSPTKTKHARCFTDHERKTNNGSMQHMRDNLGDGELQALGHARSCARCFPEAEVEITFIDTDFWAVTSPPCCAIEPTIRSRKARSECGEMR